MLPLSSLINKQTTPTKLNESSLEQNLLNCFIKQYGNKENLRVQRSINSLNVQLQKLKTDIKPNPIVNECETPRQGERQKTAQPLNTIQKKLEAIERCMVNGFSVRKNKRQQQNRQEWRSKASSVYCQESHEDYAKINHSYAEAPKRDEFMPFSFYQFRDDESVQDNKYEDIAQDKRLAQENIQLKDMLRQVQQEKDDLLAQNKQMKRQNHSTLQQQQALNDQQTRLGLQRDELKQNISKLEKKEQELVKRELELKSSTAQYIRDLNNNRVMKKQMDQERECQLSERINIDNIQLKINASIQHMLSVNRLNVECDDNRDESRRQVGIELESFETLVEATNNERLHLEKKAKYIQQLREVIDEEKRELLILRRNFV